MQKIAIIGAGIAGASLARMLADGTPNCVVSVFDKSRGVGGRMSTRRSPSVEFDHGAQFFTVRTRGFRDFLRPYEKAIKAWSANVTTLSTREDRYKRIWFEPHYVPTPRMNSLCRILLEGIACQSGQKVTGIESIGDQWFLETESNRLGPYDWVISTAPAPQTGELLNIDLSDVEYSPAFSIMARLNASPGFDAAVVKDSPIEWLAVNSAKPDRDSAIASLVAQTAPDWSRENLDREPDDLRRDLTNELLALGIADFDATETSLHRWRFARVVKAHEYPYFVDPQSRVAACGDWAVGPRIEDAFTSALALYGCISRALPIQ